MAPLCNEEDDATFSTGEDSSLSTGITNSSQSVSSAEEEFFSSALTPPTRRSVSFSPGAAVHYGAVMHVDDYSEAEKCGCWYQADEMREIRREVKEIVALMNRNEPMNDQYHNVDEMNQSDSDMVFTTHGLEGKTRVGKRNRKEARLASLAAVFDQQTMQEMDGMSDPVMIATAYIEHSFPMQVAAYQRASKTQKEAAAIYRNSTQDDEQPSSQKVFFPTDINCSFNTNTTVGPRKYEFKEYLSTLSSRNHLEKTEDDSNHSPFFPSNDRFAFSKTVADSTTKTCNENDFSGQCENENDVTSPFNIGSLTIRDRFACFLPSRNGRSVMSALQVVQI